jgi:hypothetical protein
MPPISFITSPVAVTMMSAGSSSPERSFRPVSPNVSISSVTTEALPSRIALKGSPSGAQQRGQGTRAPYILGNSRQTPSNITLSIEPNRSLLGISASQHIDLLP